MAKVAFSKLGLKKQNEIKTVIINEQEIEVKQYLPINEKLDLITRVLSGAHDQNNFANPIKIEVIGTLEIIMAYTNLNFTEKQKNDLAKLYDLLDENQIINQIIELIPESEYQFLINGIDETIKSFYSYQQSILGILDTVSADYSQLDLDASSLQQMIGDPQNLELLKNVLTKMG